MAIKAGALTSLVGGATKKWTKQKKAEERSHNAYMNRRSSMRTEQPPSQKRAAYKIMEKAYNKVSSNGKLPAQARQIMYAARPHMLQVTGKESINGEYFRTLLKDYILEHGLEDEWDVVFDARGNLLEPHTKVRVPIGTIQVKNYLCGVAQFDSKVARNRRAGKPPHDLVGNAPVVTGKHYPTKGPANRFSAIMFIEKEGFLPLFEDTKLMERWDIAIMSTKGMGVDASRHLVDDLCSDVPLFIVRDLDKAGFSISATLSGSTKYYTFANDIDVTDVGLRLCDVEPWGLDSEAAYVKGGRDRAVWNLKQNGATDDEIEFLLPVDGECSGGTNGERVELNAFTSQAFIDWLETKFREYGIEKVIPKGDVLEEAYRRAYELQQYQNLIDMHEKEITGEVADLEVPSDLEKKIRKQLKKKPHWPWDKALRKVVSEAS